MASPVNFGARAGGRRRRRFKPMNEINVTPFVDVMLTLLIIFMVSAPLMTTGVEIDLPETAAGPVQGPSGEPLAVSIDATGRVFIQDAEVAAEELVPKLKAIARNGFEERIFVRGDKAVGYGAVLQVMGRLKEAGFRRLQLIDTYKAGD